MISPGQCHLKTLFHIFIRDRLVFPVRISGFELIQMVFLAMVFLAGEIDELLGLIDIVLQISRPFHIKFPRKIAFQFFHLSLAHCMELEGIAFFLRILHEHFDYFFAVSCSDRIGIGVGAFLSCTEDSCSFDLCPPFIIEACPEIYICKGPLTSVELAFRQMFENRIPILQCRPLKYDIHI